MIRKYRYGTPFNTEALTEKIETTEGVLPYGEVSQEEGFVFTYIMDEDDIVYGLGEANRGINKRGYCYISNCTDDPVLHCCERKEDVWIIFRLSLKTDL